MVLTIFVVLSTWAAWKGVRIDERQTAIREIKRLGGLIVPQDGGPDWLRQLVGDSWMVPLDTIEKIYLDDSMLDDDGLARLKVFTELKVLSVYDTRVSEAGIKVLRRTLPDVDVCR